MNRSQSTFAAVDIGNSGLRVMRGQFADGRMTISEVMREENAPYLSPDGWRWNVTALRSAMVRGLAEADEIRPLTSVGIDTWGVDYALLDATNELLDDPFSYRDDRVSPMVEVARSRLSSEELYRLTGCQEMAINTIYQLLADQMSGRLARAATFLMMNDLANWWLTGKIAQDETNASTTGMFDPVLRDWSWLAIDAMRLDRSLFPAIVRTGTVLGETTAGSGVRAGIPVVTVGGHDTAVAFVAAADLPGALVISIGTWSLVGVEVEAPIIAEAGRRANFTNEIGVLGTIRFLRNAAGMWILQECMREWRETDPNLAWELIVREAEIARPFASLFDPDAPVFMAPGRMEARVRKAGDGDLATGRGPVVRSIIESLAMNHRWLLEKAQAVLGRELTSIRIVGGGAKNPMLCQMTANATGRDVIAGPFEATAIGNVAMQAIALGEIADLREAREIINRSFAQSRCFPQQPDMWEVAYERWAGLVSR